MLADAKKAMDTESKRIADSFRRDYERAAAAQAAIEGNLAAAQQLTITNNETAVRLRDLEREADATRTLYESFLNRAWRTGEAPNIDGTSTHIVSMAVPPKDRASPPGGLVSMIAGALAGERPIDWLFCMDRTKSPGRGSRASSTRWTTSSSSSPSTITRWTRSQRCVGNSAAMPRRSRPAWF